MKLNKQWIAIILIALVFLIIFNAGLWLRYANLGSIDFQNDEYFHLDAATGYLKTGEFVTWDFMAEEPITEYTRAFPYTWLVASSFTVLGTNEFAGRIMSVIFGIMLLPLVYYLSYRLSKNHIVALASMALIAFDQIFIWSSRLSRMYSMFVFFFVLACWLIFLGLEKNKTKFNWYYLVPGALVLGFAYLVHESALLFGLSLLFYFGANAIHLLIQKKFKWNRYFTFTAIFLGAIIIGLLFQFLIAPIVIPDYITIRDEPAWEYLGFPFNQIRIAYLGWIVLALGLLAAWKWNKLRVYYYSMFIPVLIFFTFFAGRYSAKKYIIFIIPFVLILYSDSLYNISKKLFKKKYAINLVFIILFLVTGPILSWPGIEASGIFQKARADWTYQDDEVHNFSEAYAYIEDNAKPKEPVIIQGVHTYYFSNPDLNIKKLKKDKQFTRGELKKIVSENKTGWVVWPKYKEYHLRYKLKKYVKNNMEKVEDLNDTNMQVYRWSDQTLRKK
ncbi:phospholipid carrier-dependent glycosyltransferase [Patescibacteria group bacterium]|nr:phospholipid carrier-dependent glycosyltransferase [Patescibacteria group bacterium]MBU1673251.1 phospholipid carrier-dependent glycosyltransferase [Patescibacteria group bacterium]MBU1963512.1 phospholipid carrier-dependent glycosyltransferase [Patescibacteria group bacterium]